MNPLTFDIEDWYSCDFNWDKYEVRISWFAKIGTVIHFPLNMSKHDRIVMTITVMTVAIQKYFSIFAT